MQLQETFILLASIDPWVQTKLKNKVIFVCEAPKTNKKVEPTRFRENLDENLEELNIQDFRLVQLNPLFVAKASAISDQQKKLSAQKRSACYLTSTLPPFLKHKSQATGPWARDQETAPDPCQNLQLDQFFGPNPQLPEDASQAPLRK